MKKIRISILCFLMIFPGLVLAQEYQIELEGRYWITDLAAEAKVYREGRGTDVNLRSDLSLESKNFPYGRLSWAPGPNNRLTLNYTQLNYSADTRLTKTVEFGGETYPLGSRVTGDLKVQYLRMGWAYQFINLEGGKFKLGTLLEAKGFWGDVSLSAPDLNPPVRESHNFSAWLPTIGLALDVNPHPWVNIYGEISGLPAGDYGYFFDAEAGIKLIPHKNFTITGGYRLFAVEAKDDSDYAKVRLSGPFLGLSLRF